MHQRCRERPLHDLLHAIARFFGVALALRPRGSSSENKLTPQHVLADLFGSGDFPAEILDPERAAEIVIQRLNDAGFKIESAGN